MNMGLGYTRLIVDECKRHGLLRNQCAYVLATAYHETAHTMKPVREMGGEKYLRSKKYYPYVGMGFVQLTWKANYEKAGKILGVDFVTDPKKLLLPDYSAVILVLGMRDGWFTGKSLADYITKSKSDFIGARRIVNGTDRAKLIASRAVEYDRLLKAEGYGEAKTAPAPVEPLQPVPAPKPAPKAPQPPAPAPVAKTGWGSVFAAILAFFTKGR